jgi:hypothetical protein
MGFRAMRKMRIGYWSLSPTLKSAGDRRRLKFWADARGHDIVIDRTKKVDVIVASENSDFNSKYFSQKNIPVIFDLVDAYLSPLNDFEDFARGFAKGVSGQISGSIKPFSHHVRDFCQNSSAVICSSKEQEEVISCYNVNTHVILDSHEEIPFVNQTKAKNSFASIHRILWEGQPATIRGVKIISPALVELSKKFSVGIDFVTDENYFKILNKFFQGSTLNVVAKDLSQIKDRINVIPWSVENLVNYAESSTAAIIPIDLSVPMQRLKPENRLLIMWRLGLPCLTSPSPAYVRVSEQAGVTAACDNNVDWLQNLNRLLGDPDFAYSQISAGQNYLRENHNQKILLKKWDSVFESVMG